MRHRMLGLLLAGMLGLGLLVAPTPGALTAAAVAADTAGYPKQGQRSGSVRALQDRLNDGGYLGRTDVTGYFGTRTAAALTRLQRAYRLKATGRVDAATLRALARAVLRRLGPVTYDRTENLGTTTGKRRILAYHAGEKGKPVVVVLATMHGDEDFGQYVARGLLRGKPVKGVELWVVPVANPDGLVADRRWLAHGVDLNRNFPHRFTVTTHSGPKAASAPETRALMRFLDAKNPRYVVSWHQPLYGVDAYGVKDRALMNRLAEGLRLPVRSFACRSTCHGTLTGWFNARHRGAAITVEYGTRARAEMTMRGRDANAVLAAVGGRRG